MTLRVGIAGLGRIGRGLLRTNYTQAKAGRFDICVVCDVMPVEHVAYLIANDSTYGNPPFSVDCTQDELVINGKKIRYLQVGRRRNPVDGADLNVLRHLSLDVFVDATGTAALADLQRYIEQNAAPKVVCTSNIGGADISLVYGVNHRDYDPARHHIITASTCTGNAMVPVAHILERHFGINFARIITIHPALADQRVLDGYHATAQLGRSYMASVIPVPTNVAKSTALVLPELEGKLESLSYRVPTAIVSILDVSASLKTSTSREECVALFEEYAQNQFKGIIQCEYGAWGQERASIDFSGSEYSAILLMKHIVVNSGTQLGLSIMHDNEQAYCCRALDVLNLINQSN
ncbi:MAG: glyceraldehyde-3-phosphate dehydrogenase [Methylobacter sp.]|nr:MAG: glyceraldehyde-3-phosphate dehydrogenase [Methylobacter sp.]PPD32120.1 MAG: glyceraldehyde-3-phosphate dehydrogenase [Methylomonas sp.]